MTVHEEVSVCEEEQPVALKYRTDRSLMANLS